MRAIIQVSAIAAMVFASLATITPQAQAGTTWDEIKPDVFGDRQILPASDVVRLSAPVRPDDQSHVPISVNAQLEDGRTIRAITMIVDENPTPVAAVFDIGADREKLQLTTKFRLNSATDVRVILEASDGKLYMDARHVKFAGGQASCSAPPNGDPEEIAANMGKMKLAHAPQKAATSQMRPKASVTVSHPNHTGMVLDQITLLYIPLRIVSEMEVRQGEERVFAMRGSMTLSQDPQVGFDYRVNGAQKMQVFVKDTDGASWQREFLINQGS